ncbi:spore cortex biosynthesis protein YabQ [Thermoactinomyces mirandus]|uniref:Spore cortex biosynthesis protein YabQ n=1 Tax=Thermoactinomyces mirandus TaxID=2756294 RepID=A0A7W1XQ95_9BACL|nr:spore cortex biosynthesis protein YabQ [Thermoactinomyces mirandus]MBA4601259.1 spore cortex biosynthesis protein YabQ [Thermoactinomyces mirandus]
MTLQAQWLTMALMFGSGFFIGLILDFYRVLTARFRLRGWLVSLIDLLYWIVSAALVCGLLFWSNWGELRFYFFVAVCAGFFIYFKWASRHVIYGIRMLLNFVERILSFLFRLLYLCCWVPVNAVWAVSKRIILFFWKGIHAVVRLMLSPLVFLFRPVIVRVHPWWKPWFQKGKVISQKVKAWWNKKR